MAAITMSGMNGIDFNSILDSVMQYESLPLKGIQDDQTKVQSKDAAFVSLSGIISALQTPVSSLTGSSSFSGVAATSSDPTTATVSTGEGGSIGQYSVSTTQLAKNQVTKSTNGYSAVTDVAANGGSISFTINGTTTTPITIGTDTTLSGLKDQINAQSSGVMASIVNDGTNYKLVISSRETGVTKGFTINDSLTNSGGTAVAYAAGQSPIAGNAQDAQNALFKVNGIDIVSASNTVADAIPGTTLKLLKTGAVTVDVTNDFAPIKDNLKTIVTQYNKMRLFYTQQTKGALGAGDPVLREVLNDIKSVFMTSNSNGGRYHYLAEIGLELTSNGDLKLDESKLDTAMNSYPDDVQKLFKGSSGTNGILNSLKTTLNNLDGTAGLIKTTRDSIQTTMTKFRDRIDRQQMMLEIRRKELQKMYAAADQAMSQLSSATTSIANLQRSF